MLTWIKQAFSALPESPAMASDLVREADQALKLQVPSERVAYGPLIQHLSVRDEEQYQAAIKAIRKNQEDNWISGILIPGMDDDGEIYELHVYLELNGDAHKVGRLRNSMVEPIYEELLREYEENQRVIPIIAKVAPGRKNRELGVIAYAKTDLIHFPAY